ncbi:MAG: hypothetical protein FWC18_05855 [Cystobacterineae bacterium]|nr:hypothetical protein [Cystobacterineae bacterium]MCL2259329.1 hypothetical protein [Cystobacterineae bacterium]
MKAQKLAQTVVLALSVSACHVLGTCTVGNDDDTVGNNMDCPKDALCYGGKNSKPGKNGICVWPGHESELPALCMPGNDAVDCPLGSFPLGAFCLRGNSSKLDGGICIPLGPNGQPALCEVGNDAICPPYSVCYGGENAAPGDAGLCIVPGSPFVSCTAGSDDRCPSGAACYGGGQNACNPGERCVPTEMGATEGTCQPLLSPQPLLARAQFSSDCTSLELSGNAGIQPPAAYASSTGSISTLCPEGVSGSSTGFRCPLSNSATNPFSPSSHSAQWTVKDSLGVSGSSSAYAFQTVLANTASLFPMTCVMPSAVLGRDAMEGRQALTPQAIASPHPLGGCWVGTGLRGSIAAGNRHTCALQVDGTVRCWGSNGDGQATPPEGLSSVVAIAADEQHTCALQANGKVSCWGSNDDGRATPLEDLGPVVAIAAGSWHTCALQADGTVVCWGDNRYGQRAIPSGLNSVVAIAAGNYHACALQADGTVVCWGDNRYGQRAIPSGLNSVVAIAAGGYHTCALQTNGKVSCWGDNYYDQRIIPPELNSVVAIAAGGYHTCALQADGKVSCWGSDSNRQGQKGIPSGLSSVVAIAAGGWHTCALQTNGKVSCWGWNNFGQATGASDAAVQTMGQLVIQ